MAKRVITRPSKRKTQSLLRARRRPRLSQPPGKRTGLEILFTAEGKKGPTGWWKQVERASLTRLKVDQAMKDNLLGKRDPAVLAEFVKDLTGRK